MELLIDEMFSVDGSIIKSPRGPMPGKVTFKVLKKINEDYVLCQLFGTERPENDWMLGQACKLSSERISSHESFRIES